MDNEGFTGIDTYRFKNEIENYKKLFYEIENGFSNACNEFFDKTAMKWASPNAELFGKVCCAEFTNFATDFSNYYEQTVSKLYDAYNSLARANGLTELIYNSESYVPNFNHSYKKNINGVTGMATGYIETYRDEFVSSLRKIVELMDTLPKSIGFYDSNGNIIDDFSMQSSVFTDKVKELVTNVEKVINRYIEEEVNNLLLAKQQVEETLKS